jgi:DNA-binding NarL/FixJ family response regulator
MFNSCLIFGWCQAFSEIAVPEGGTSLGNASIRVLVVDDYEPWRRFVAISLHKQLELQIIDEAPDGLEAVQKAEALQPDLILLDIGLPTLNGIDAARRIRKVSPASKILFLSENRSADVAAEALSVGAGGYVLKSEAACELLPAIKAVLEGKRFVSANLAGPGLNGPPHPQTGASLQPNKVATLTRGRTVEVARHEVSFYSTDQHLLEHVTRFIGAGLRAGDAAIIVATESHRESLLSRLQAYGLDVSEAIQQGRYIALDAAELMRTLIVDGRLDSKRFLDDFGNLVENATKAARRKNSRVAVFGEGVDLLVAQGNVEAALQNERLCNRLITMYDVDILCGYSLSRIPSSHPHCEQVCAQHSAVHSA